MNFAKVIEFMVLNQNIVWTVELGLSLEMDGINWI